MQLLISNYGTRVDINLKLVAELQQGMAQAVLFLSCSLSSSSAYQLILNQMPLKTKSKVSAWTPTGASNLLDAPDLKSPCQDLSQSAMLTLQPYDVLDSELFHRFAQQGSNQV